MLVRIISFRQRIKLRYRRRVSQLFEQLTGSTTLELDEFISSQDEVLKSEPTVDTQSVAWREELRETYIRYVTEGEIFTFRRTFLNFISLILPYNNANNLDNNK